MKSLIWIVAVVGLAGAMYTWSGGPFDISPVRPPVVQDGVPRFDFTSEITRAESFNRVKAKLSKDERSKLTTAILRLMSAKIMEERTLAEAQTLAQLDANRAMGDQIHGLSAAEAIAKAAKVNRNRTYRDGSG